MTATFSFPPDAKARIDMLMRLLAKQGVRNLTDDDSLLHHDRRDGESGSIAETDATGLGRAVG